MKLMLLIILDLRVKENLRFDIWLSNNVKLKT